MTEIPLYIIIYLEPNKSSVEVMKKREKGTKNKTQGAYR